MQTGLACHVCVFTPSFNRTNYPSADNGHTQFTLHTEMVYHRASQHGCHGIVLRCHDQMSKTKNSN